MFVHMIISYTITQQVLTRALHLMLFAWGPGTGVAIYSIAESSDDVGGPFSCQCIAKQCST